jgi:hypothetical protein
MSDNRIFNVNGRLDGGGEKLLEQALELAFAIAGYKGVVAWRVTRKSGLILDWTDGATGSAKLPAPMNAKQVMSIVLPWLQSEAAKETELDSWDMNADHDGDNGPGWRVYCGEWGHVEGWHAIVAVKPVFMWYGK